ncbi:MAG: DUF2007 domain-containing protein [Clostridia bacterium]|nr:DUF2007 domain-containing protein [Clostridia bacterium]
MSFLDKLFGLDKPEKTTEETGVLLTTAHGNEELAAIEALLRSAEIPYRLTDRGAGGVVRVISGYTMYGTDVFVREEDLETAQELLAPVDEEAKEPSEEEA